MKTIKPIIIIAITFAAVGCASPGSPRVTVEKNQTINVYPSGERASNITIDARYRQDSATDLEAALEQALDIAPDIDITP